MKQRSIFLGMGLWFGVSLLGILGGLGPVAINGWSVAFLARHFEGGANPMELPAPPATHRHARVWLAEAALAGGSPQAAKALLTPLLAQGDVLAWRVQGEIAFASGEPLEAVAAWAQIWDRASLLRYAALSVTRGEWAVAEEIYRFLWQEKRSEAAVLPYAAFLSGELKKPSAGIALLEEAIAQFPRAKQSAEWLRALGDLLLAEARRDEAIAQYQAAIAQDPKLYWAYIGLGDAHLNPPRDPALALAWYREAIHLKPDQAIAYHRVAEMYADEGQHAEADAWYGQAIERNPAARWWWLAQANNLRQAGEYEAAQSRYEQTAAQFPGWAAVYHDMAWNYRLNEQAEPAQAAIEKAIALAETPNIWYYLRAGQIYEWSAEFEKALAAYQSALVVDPSNQAAQKGVQRLETKGDSEK